MKLETVMVELTDEQEVINKEIKRLKKSIDRAEAKLAIAKSKCTNHIFSVKGDYIPGDYYDTAYTAYSQICVICGKWEKLKEDRHSHYG